MRHPRGAQRRRVPLHARAHACTARHARSPGRLVPGNAAMDAALLLMLIAARARAGAMPDRAWRDAGNGHPGGRLGRRERGQVRGSMVTRWWRAAARTLSVLAGRDVAPGRMRPAWMRALCE